MNIQMPMPELVVKKIHSILCSWNPPITRIPHAHIATSNVTQNSELRLNWKRGFMPLRTVYRKNIQSNARIANIKESNRTTLLMLRNSLSVHRPSACLSSAFIHVILADRPGPGSNAGGRAERPIGHPARRSEPRGMSPERAPFHPRSMSIWK